jgi:hypothetical protein
LLIDGVGEVADAIEAIVAVDRIAASFAVKNVPTDLLSEGYYLEAAGAKGPVRIYRDAGDGSPAALVTDIDRASVQQSIKQSGEETHPTKIQTKGNSFSG